MTGFEEVNQRFRAALRSIENNNKNYFPNTGDIFNSYSLEQVGENYSIKVKPSLPGFITVQIEAAFLHARAKE